MPSKEKTLTAPSQNQGYGSLHASMSAMEVISQLAFFKSEIASAQANIFRVEADTSRLTKELTQLNIELGKLANITDHINKQLESLGKCRTRQHEIHKETQVLANSVSKDIEIINKTLELQNEKLDALDAYPQVVSDLKSVMGESKRWLNLTSKAKTLAWIAGLPAIIITAIYGALASVEQAKELITRFFK